MHFKPSHTHLPLWELRAWYHELWPVQRWLVNAGILVIAFILLSVVFKEPRMPNIDAKNQLIADVRSDRYENYEPDPIELAQRAQQQLDITPPKRYETYLNNTRNQTNRHRKLKHKYKHKKDSKHVKQSGSTR